jgi:hypothetical protein
MLSRLLTKVLGSRRDEHSEARQRAGRLEARLNELRLELLVDGRALSNHPASLVPDTINRKAPLLDGRDSLNGNVQAGVAGDAASDAGTPSFSDAKVGDEFTAATIIAVQSGQPAGPAAAQNGTWTGAYDSFTITGTATPNGGSHPLSTIVWDPGQSIAFTVSVKAYASATNEAAGNVAFIDEIATTLDSAARADGMARFTLSGLRVDSQSITTEDHEDAKLTMATLPVLEENLLPSGTFSGNGTFLNQQDVVTLNVQAPVAGGVPSDSGTLSFADSAAGDSFTAATITSIQVYQADSLAPGGHLMEACSYFRIAGTASHNGGTGAGYCFEVAISLPVVGATNPTGFLTLQVSGPSGVFDSTRTWSTKVGRKE